MGEVALSASAGHDLEEIGDRMARDDPSRAVRSVEGSPHASDGLACLELAYVSDSLTYAMPLTGRRRPAIRGGLRSLVHGPDLVLHLPKTAGITVLRVIHGAREIASMPVRPPHTAPLSSGGRYLQGCHS